MRRYSPLFLAFSLIFLSLRKMHRTELAAKLRVSGHLRSDVSLPLRPTQTPGCHRIREVLVCPSAPSSPPFFSTAQLPSFCREAGPNALNAEMAKAAIPAKYCKTEAAAMTAFNAPSSRSRFGPSSSSSANSIANTVPINNIACSLYHCMFKTATEINHARHYCSTASFGAAIRIGEYDASINSILMFRS